MARLRADVSGNKRTAWAVAHTFIAFNRGKPRFEPVDATNRVIALAAGQLREDELADWFRRHLAPNG